MKPVYQLFSFVTYDYIVKCASGHGLSLKATNTTSVNRSSSFHRSPSQRVCCDCQYEQSAITTLITFGVDQLHHEMHVSFSTRDNNIHPDTHGLGGRSHHVVHPIVGLHAERQRGVGALE